MGLQQQQAFDLEQVDHVLVQHLVVGLLVPDQREQRHDLLIVPVLVHFLQALPALGLVSGQQVLDHGQLGLQHHHDLLVLLLRGQQELLHHDQQELRHHGQQGQLLLHVPQERLHRLFQQVLLLLLFLLVLQHPLFQLEQHHLFQLVLDLFQQVLPDPLVLLELQVLLLAAQPGQQALELGQRVVAVAAEQLVLQELVEELVVLLAWALVQGQGQWWGQGQELGSG